MKTKLLVQIAVEGYHCWPGAPSEVDFLRARHRHTFFIKGEFKARSLDREQEFFILRDKMKAFASSSWGHLTCEFGAMSCEMIAAQFLNQFKPFAACAFEVWEEETGGARVEA